MTSLLCEKIPLEMTFMGISLDELISNVDMLGHGVESMVVRYDNCIRGIVEDANLGTFESIIM